MRITQTILFLFIIVIKLAGSAFAAEEFEISYNVVFEAKSDSSVHVEQTISMTNIFSNIYATSYSLTIDKTSPVNIKAFDASGNLNLTTRKDGDSTTIIVNFNNPVVGKGKTSTFNIAYDSPELVKKSGQIWEVMVPRVINIEKMSHYELNLKVPLNFGLPAYISPRAYTNNKDGEYQIYVFKKDQLVNSGVVAAFGEFQLFDFNLYYHLNNPLNEPVITNIAIPPDTELQKISYKSIEPKPTNIEIDQDGNWLATYRLEPQIKRDVKVSGQVKIFASPISFDYFSGQKLEDYLTAQKYWETDDPQIIKLAKTLKTPERIYDYVVEHLRYDYSRVREGAERIGAKGILENPQKAMCMEFSDLFVAISRAAGIPARVLNGYSFTDNSTLKPLSLVQDILHAWPEYWDEVKGIWVQIDPTWQNTTGGIDYFNKLDLGHFVFSIHGLDSQYPIPAGGYKEVGLSQKDIDITFGGYQSILKGDLNINFEIPNPIFNEKSNKGTIIIKNIGSEAIYNPTLNLLSEKVKVLLKEDNLNIIPPFGSINIPVEITASNRFTSGQGKITVIVNGKPYEKLIVISSLILTITKPLILCLIFITLFIRIITKIKSWRKSRSQIV